MESASNSLVGLRYMPILCAMHVLPCALLTIGLYCLSSSIEERSVGPSLIRSLRMLTIVVLPSLAFLASLSFTPDLRSDCRFGWLDCFSIGKVALVPAVIWAMGALCALEGEPTKSPSWAVRAGVLLGAIVSTVCLLHGLVTFSEEIGLAQYTLLPLRWGLVVPLYVAIWYWIRSVELVRDYGGSWRLLVGGLVVVSPMWLLSLYFSMVFYNRLT